MLDESTTKPPATLIHWEKLPPQREGTLVTLPADEHNYTVSYYLMRRGIPEAWVYSNEGNRYMAFYQLPEAPRRSPIW